MKENKGSIKSLFVNKLNSNLIMDNLNKKERSQMMSKIKSKDTEPEMLTRNSLTNVMAIVTHFCL